MRLLLLLPLALAGCGPKAPPAPTVAFRPDVAVRINSWHAHALPAGSGTGAKSELVCNVSIKNNSKQQIPGFSGFAIATQKGQMDFCVSQAVAPCSRCSSPITSIIQPGGEASGDLVTLMEVGDTPVNAGAVAQ